MSKTEKHKILWIDVVSILGGAQLSMLEVCKKLTDHNVTIEVALPNGPLSDKLKEAGLTVYPISPIRASRKGFALFTTAAKLLRSPHTISQIARECKPDLIHANSLAAFMTTVRVPSAIPLLWHVRDIQNNPHLIRGSIHRAAGIVTASESIDEGLTDMISMQHRGKLHLIRNGIDTSIFSDSNKDQLRSELMLPQGLTLIGMVAHLIPWKRHDVFIESAALIHKALPDAHFVIFGRDLFNENKRYLKQLHTLVEERGLEGCFHWIDNSNAPQTFMPALDLLIHPPRHEPFGRIICEAMASGVPVIAADSGGPSTIIFDKVTGRLAADGTSENFAAIAVELLNSPQSRGTITFNARKHILKNYTVDRVCKDLIKVYNDVIRRTRENREYAPDKD